MRDDLTASTLLPRRIPGAALAALRLAHGYPLAPDPVLSIPDALRRLLARCSGPGRHHRPPAAGRAR